VRALVALAPLLLLGPLGCGPGAVAPRFDGGHAPSTPDLPADSPGDLGSAIADLASAPPAFITAQGVDLFVGTQRFRFVGANRYDLASFAPGSGKFMCGRGYSDTDLDQLMGELATFAGATVLRMWAFQSFTLGGTDWSTLDRAIATAKKHGLRLIFTLENEWQNCTTADPASADGRKSAGWFGSGYKSPLGTAPLSYRDYVQLVVARYKDEGSVAMWQLMNEAESSDAAALLAFATDMAQVVKTIDAKHLLSLGTIGTGQPGTQGSAYHDLYALPGLDVIEAHDYGAEAVAMPGPIGTDVTTAAGLGKPFFIGEAGIAAPSPRYTYSFTDRATYMDAKVKAHWAAGSDGFLVWSFYDLAPDNWQGWDFGPTDPLAAVLKARAADPL
jgi:hypothetical protein